MNVEPNKPIVHIRPATPDDALSIESVLFESFAEYEAFYTREAFAATTPVADRISSRMNEGPTWVALLRHSIVGTVSVVPKEEALYVRSMAVLPTARGHRIGELLLNEIECYAVDHDYKRLFLNTTPFLSRAIRLYERFGFQRTVDGPHDLFGTPLFTMIKNLKALE